MDRLGGEWIVPPTISAEVVRGKCDDEKRLLHDFGNPTDGKSKWYPNCLSRTRKALPSRTSRLARRTVFPRHRECVPGPFWSRKKTSLRSGPLSCKRKNEVRGDVIIVDTGHRTISNVPEVLPLLSRFETVCPPFEQLCTRVLRSFTQVGVASEEPMQSFTMQVILAPEEAMRGGVGQIRVPVFYPCPT